LLDEIFAIDSTILSNTERRYFDYTVGFDNVKLGYSEYAERSIYVSNTLTVDNLAQIGLRATALLENDDGPLGSIEYWALCNNFTDNDTLINTEIFPLLPIGTSRVEHERFILTAATAGSEYNIGELIHYAIPAGATIQVYQNGVLLTENVDWTVNEDFSNHIVPVTGTRNKVALQISNPQKADFYTVSYTPTVSNSRIDPTDIYKDLAGSAIDDSVFQSVDLTGDGTAISASSNVVYTFPLKNNGQVTKYTKVYLMIILRRNSIDRTLTPVLEDYTLLTSSRNIDKYAEQ
jgi:hypothetical protein